jgi:nucleotide-binding universal stress UspA family protein
MARILVDRGRELEEEAIENMAKFRRKGMDGAINELTGIPEVCTFIEAGELDLIVRKRIEAGKAELIIMGTTGLEKPLANLVGTNSTYMIDEATVPVLIIPNEADYRPLNRICYATDLKHLDPFRVTDLLELLAPYLPTVDFVHVATSENKDTEYNLSMLRRVIDRPQIHDRLAFTRINGKDEVEELLRYARASEADLLVMNRPHRGWLERIFKHSHTREAMLKAELPLLILHNIEQ